MGAGPVGCVLALVLAQHGARVRVVEKRPDMRHAASDSGRSINLVLTRRGLRALEMVGLKQRVLETLTIPVKGRMMHDVEGQLTYQPYGRDDTEHNHSVSRSELNAFLLGELEARGVTVLFDHALEALDLDARRIEVERGDGARDTLPFSLLFGADGAPSATRRDLVERGLVREQIEMLDYGYKEVDFPASADGSYPMADYALHIWPRGDHMLMGLANLDGSFTGTLYLPNEGEGVSFEAIETPAEARALFEAHYPDALPKIPSLGDQVASNPVGVLGTVRCEPWHVGGDVLLVGDAAHGIVPFFGQGLNSGFEDCVILDELLTDWSASPVTLFERFYTARKPNTDAIAEMALENFVEMRDKVGDPHFLEAKQLERMLETELGDQYRSRYATVMYSLTPYRDALEAGAIQHAILQELLHDMSGTPIQAEQVDLAHAKQLIAQKLTPFYVERRIDLSFGTPDSLLGEGEPTS